MTRLALVLLVVAASKTHAQAMREPAREPSRPLAAAALIRNPAFLRASQILTRREPGEAPKVRFQWERVPGATAYLLRGNWAADRGWAVKSAEYRVTSESATEWGTTTVTFEVSLQGGEHAWNVVAISGDPSAADFATPARLAFRLE